MSVDLLDAAFLRRLAAPVPRAAAPRGEQHRAALRPEHPANAAPPTADAPPAVVAAQSSGASIMGSPPTDIAERPRSAPADARPCLVPRAPARDDIDDPLVSRLLALAPEQWDALAGHVEAARQRGRRVVAVAGGRAGEGRTTLVRCLAATLRARGRDVACAVPHDLAAVAAGPDGRGPTHDKRIVLVDAGIWFPPGPIRRSLLQVASLGCEAAILVRRLGGTGGLARQAALEGLGIEVLGEVLTFTQSGAVPDIQTGDAAA